jgi:hypothetical protein
LAKGAAYEIVKEAKNVPLLPATPGRARGFFV